MSIQVREVTIEEAIRVHDLIPEFDAQPVEYFTDRYADREHLLLVAYIDDKPAGYMVSYEKPEEDCFYIWMAGVLPAFRRNGVLTELIEYVQEWASETGYKLLRIKTRNNRREMLSFLVKRGFCFYDVHQRDEREEHRILLELPLEN